LEAYFGKTSKGYLILLLTEDLTYNGHYLLLRQIRIAHRLINLDTLQQVVYEITY